MEKIRTLFYLKKKKKLFKYTLYLDCKISYSLINYIVFSQAIRYCFYISRSSYFKFILIILSLLNKFFCSLTNFQN